MSEKINEYFDDELAIQEAEPTTKQPSLYKVILVNDDFTPMEFVVHILELFFSIDRENATRIMQKFIRVEKEFADYLLVKLQKPKSLL